MNPIKRYRQWADPGAPLLRLVMYAFFRLLTRIMLSIFYRYRIDGLERIPSTGPALIVSNHQSHLDPLIVGGTTWRHCYFLARRTLWSGKWHGRLFGRLIGNLNAIPLDQENPDLRAIKSAIARLREGQLLVIFAEGSRTPDGIMQDFKEGTSLLIRRAKTPVIPVALDGAYDIWPRARSFPRLRGLVGVKIGRPIPYEELKAAGDGAALELIRSRIETLRLEIRDRLRAQSKGHYPPAGLGDVRYDEIDASTDQPAPSASHPAAVEVSDEHT